MISVEQLQAELVSLEQQERTHQANLDAVRGARQMVTHLLALASQGQKEDASQDVRKHEEQGGTS